MLTVPLLLSLGLALAMSRQSSPRVPLMDFLRQHPAMKVSVSTEASFRWLPTYASQDRVCVVFSLPGAPGGRLGIIEVVTGPGGMWEMDTVMAVKGYGPLLYDFVLELATAAGAPGVLPDRSGVSEAAEYVWEHYLTSRSDVTSSPLPDTYPDFNKHTLRYRDHLDRSYRKEGLETLRAIAESGRLEIIDPDGVLDLEMDGSPLITHGIG